MSGSRICDRSLHWFMTLGRLAHCCTVNGARLTLICYLGLRRRFIPGLAAGDRRAQNPAIRIIDRDPLIAERDNRHDGLPSGTGRDSLDRLCLPMARGADRVGKARREHCRKADDRVPDDLRVGSARRALPD